LFSVTLTFTEADELPELGEVAIQSMPFSIFHGVSVLVTSKDFVEAIDANDMDVGVTVMYLGVNVGYSPNSSSYFSEHPKRRRQENMYNSK